MVGWLTLRFQKGWNHQPAIFGICLVNTSWLIVHQLIVVHNRINICGVIFLFEDGWSRIIKSWILPWMFVFNFPELCQSFPSRLESRGSVVRSQLSAWSAGFGRWCCDWSPKLFSLPRLLQGCCSTRGRAEREDWWRRWGKKLETAWVFHDSLYEHCHLLPCAVCAIIHCPLAACEEALKTGTMFACSTAFITTNERLTLAKPLLV